MNRLGGRPYDLSVTAGCFDLAVSMFLDGCCIVAVRILGLETDEEPLGTDDDVGQAAHHRVTAVNLEAEPTVTSELVHDVSAAL